MNITQMTKNNIMIGTAILSMYAEKANKDSIDLMIPFTKYALQENYNIDDIIDVNKLVVCLRDQFAFYQLPSAIVEKTLRRLCKNNGCVERDKNNYKFVKSVSEEHDKIKSKKQQAMQLVNNIINNLMPYLNERLTLKKLDEEKTKKHLFMFLDKYGLLAYEQGIISDSRENSEHINHLIGSFILEENEKKSEVFNNLVDVIKGFFLSKAIYLQNDTDDLMKAKMKDTVFILDAPLMLKMLGLKSEGENRAAKELMGLIPPQVKLRYFSINFEELESIIKSYKHSRVNGYSSGQTLEYFEEHNYSIEDIETYYVQLEKKLRTINIFEYENKIPIDSSHMINEVGLSKCLREKIPSYVLKEKTLRNDVESIISVSQIRQGRKPSTIENCKVIFVTNNNNLAHYTNSFLGEIKTVGPVISDVDLSVILWLKSSQRNKNMPKDLLVANALAATEEVTDVFMSGVLSKIKKFEEEGNFDTENAGLILENIYLRRELVKECESNPENLTVDKVKRLKDKYEEKIIKAAGIDNGTLRAELAVAQDEKSKAQKERSSLVDAIKGKAQEKAKKISNICYWTFLIVIYTIFLAIAAFGIAGCVIDSAAEKISVWVIVLLIVSVMGLLDLLCGKLKFIIKAAKKIKLKVYDKVFSNNIMVLNIHESPQ